MVYILIVLPIVLILCYHYYPFLQVGPTCGMYAIVEAANINSRNILKKQRKASMLIHEAIARKLTNVGEIFSIDAMEKIINCYNNMFPEDEVCHELVLFHNKNELKNILDKNEIVIFPYKAKTYLHYGVLIKTKKGYKMYDGIRGYYRNVDIEYLYNRHKLLGKTFSWEGYMKKKTFELKHFITNPRLYLFIERCHKNENLTGTVHYGVKYMAISIRKEC